MPSGVRMTVVVLGLLAAYMGAGLLGGVPPGPSFLLPVPLTLIVFLRGGYPLARHWTLALAWVVLLGTLAAFLARANLPSDGLGWLLGRVVFLAASAALILGLRTSSARAHFGLHCDACRSDSVRAAGFLDNKLRCRTCKHVWNHREEGMDLNAFD